MVINKKCVHVQCYELHFKFAINLIKGFYKYANDFAKFDFIIVVNDKSEELMLKGKIDDITYLKFNNVIVKNIQDIINQPFEFLEYNESFSECDESIINNKNLFNGGYWGSASTYTRKWMNIKRSYGLLDIYRMGYEHVWCVDAESFPLKKFSIGSIFEYSVKYNLLAVYKYGGWNDHRIINEVLKISKNKKNNELFQIGVRINDFWLIKLEYFKLMIQELTELHKNPLSFFVLGTEQGLYELYLFNKHLSNQLEINVFDFDKKYFDDILDLPSYGSGNTAVNCVLYNLLNDVTLKKVDVSEFNKRINKFYFNKVYSYRGDFIKTGPKKIINELNLKFAVSNWQESSLEKVKSKLISLLVKLRVKELIKKSLKKIR